MTRSIIDRHARDHTREALRAYIRGEIRSFALADRLDQIESDDPVVRLAHDALWLYYDDLKDVPLASPAESQRTLRRLDLVLASDATATRAKGRHATSRTTASGAALWPFASFSGLRRAREANHIEPPVRDLRRTNPAPGDPPARHLLLPSSACCLVFAVLLWLMPLVTLIGAAIILLGFVACRWSVRRSLHFILAE